MITQRTLKIDKKKTLNEIIQGIKAFQRRVVVAEVCSYKLSRYPHYVIGRIKNTWEYPVNGEYFVIFHGRNKNYATRTDAYGSLCPRIKEIRSLRPSGKESGKPKDIPNTVFGIFGDKIGMQSNVLYVCVSSCGIEAASVIYEKTKTTEVFFDYIGKMSLDMVLL
uniref:Uncharacterized protein n=1 Tax=candidate division CPR3 bacterium TaxID=2268181 RepID=A0A7C4R5Y3_UNCC3